MSKPYTEQALSDSFDNDLTWRRKELSDIKSAIKAADTLAKAVLIRALVTMSYAHWEGYVKTCANRYFEYLPLRKRPFSDFDSQFYINSFLARLDGVSRGGANIEARCKLVSDILNGGHSRFSYIHPTLIDTRSNLNADVTKDICIVCGVNGDYFEQRRIFIDTIILKRRNAIAHGQQEFIAESEIDDFVAEVLALMGHFRTLLENKIYSKSYLAA